MFSSVKSLAITFYIYNIEQLFDAVKLFYCFLLLFIALYYIVYMVCDDMICVKCKKSIPDGSAYCNHCGARQERAAPKHKRGNGTGNAYRRGNTWTARWTEKIYLGDDDRMVQQMRTKGGFKTKTAALAYAAAVHEDVKPAPTLRDYWKQYTRSFYLDLSHDKQTAYDIAWGKLSSVADVSIGELTTAQLQDVIDSKTPTYYPARDVKTILSHCYRAAIADGNATVNLSEYLRLPKLEEKEINPFTEIEIHKLWKAYADGRADVGLVLLMIYTGMMPGELRRLTVDMIHLDEMEIRGAGLKTKKRKAVPIVLPDVIAPVVVDLMDGKTDKIVPWSEDYFYKRYYAALEASGVRRLTPYSCRHTTATALALGNIAPSVIQEVMRHSKFSTTHRYIHPDTDSAKLAVNSIKK